MDLSDDLLAWAKEHILDPQLRELGLDPDRYELAYELPMPAPEPITQPLDIERMSVLQKIATALDIPPEVIAANADVNWVTATDPYNVAAFERTRRQYMPRWRYVSGGKALHAFIGGSDRPACGIDPRRGRDRHPARWIDGDPTRRTSWRSGPHNEHSPCARAVREHRDAMLRGPS